MSIHAELNPITLNTKRFYKLDRSTLESAYKRILHFAVNHKNRGYRIRVVPHYEFGILELAGKSAGDVDMAVRSLRDGGFKICRTPLPLNFGISSQIS